MYNKLLVSTVELVHGGHEEEMSDRDPLHSSQYLSTFKAIVDVDMPSHAKLAREINRIDRLLRNQAPLDA